MSMFEQPPKYELYGALPLRIVGLLSSFGLLGVAISTDVRLHAAFVLSYIAAFWSCALCMAEAHRILQGANGTSCALPIPVVIVFEVFAVGWLVCSYVVTFMYNWHSDGTSTPPLPKLVVVVGNVAMGIAIVHIILLFFDSLTCGRWISRRNRSRLASRSRSVV